MKLELSRLIFEKCSNVKFIKIRSVGAEFCHAGGRTGGRVYRQTWRR